MAVKRITIRVPQKLHQQLTQISSEQDKSLNTLAVEALESYTIQAGRFPLQQLSDILAPAAEAEGISEEELLELASTVRQHIWKERYEKLVHEIVS
jgi:predicted transcriptional regulator